jgi:hypothetical protein
MTRIVLDAAFWSKLQDLKQPLELCDESGRVLARLVPVPDPSEHEPTHPDPAQEHQRNEAAFRRLKPLIEQTYPPGRFVAIAEGRIVGDAERLDLLRSRLQASGKDPSRVFVVQAGVDYPESAVIFVQDAPA